MTEWTHAQQADEGTTKFAMKIFVASWTFSFVALLAAYLVLRLQADAWPPAGQPAPPLLFTGLATLMAVGSSVVLQLGINDMNRGFGRSIIPALGFTVAFGTLFLACQTVAGAQAYGWGLRPGSSAYGALFWVTALFHAAHVAVGTVALGVLFRRARRSGLSPRRKLSIELWAYFWHSIGLAWIGIFMVMVVPR
ncbi:MAG: heme-copper oxidase subunit III [Myxococcota bacterium]